MGTMCERVGVVGSKRLKSIRLGVTLLTVALPGFAHAAPLGILDSPAPTYYNDVTAYYGSQNYAHQTATNPTPGLVLDGNMPNTTPPTYYSVATGNYYDIPYVSASLSVTGYAGAAADSRLTYYIEFSGPTGGSTTINVRASDGASAPNDTSGCCGAAAYLSIHDQNYLYDSITLNTISEQYAGLGEKVSTFDQAFAFKNNVIYTVFMEAYATANAYQSPDPTAHSLADAFVDPYFDLSNLPDGVTFLESANIGDSLPGATPIPAALPLFASGLGALGLAGWRRKKKVAA